MKLTQTREESLLAFCFLKSIYAYTKAGMKMSLHQDTPNMHREKLDGQ